MIISIEISPLKLMKRVKSNDELSSIESRINKKETANSAVLIPVVSLMIPSKNVLMQAKTIKQINGYNSVIERGTRR